MKLRAQNRRANAAGTIVFFLLMCLLPSRDARGTTPAVKIAQSPLYIGPGNMHPNMLLSLSLEFPTVGIAYRADSEYNRTDEYVGYFNPHKCYTYKGDVTDGFFAISKGADANHECGGDSFSGNFMNWAATSSIDILRYALTGGDRIKDTEAETILQRALLKEDFYASESYFPRRSVKQGGNASEPDKITPFKTETLHIVSCRNRILFSDIKQVDDNNKDNGKCSDMPAANADKKFGEFLVRVKVCDAGEGPERIDLCQSYGTSYKPVGELQRNADKMRFAVMGYLLDNAEKRYGGVLRSGMKYIGPKKFAEPGFTEAANDTLEWDPATGVLYSNPDDPADRNSTIINSGVINYINKFGRSGGDVAGLYKDKDPVGELYYEGLRFLQGKQPTPQATADMTVPMKDGFKVQATWSDPVAASCQGNYIVSIADVNTHYDRYIPGNERTTYIDTADQKNLKDAYDPVRAADAAVDLKTPELDVKIWTKKVGEMEADVDGKYKNSVPRPNLANLDAQDHGANGRGTYYMAGLAYWANTNDIRLDKPVRVKTVTIDLDEGGNGKIDGSTRTIPPRDSQLYLAAKYGGFNDANKNGNPFITADADGKTLANNTEWDSNADGVPDNYFLAGQPKELIKAIKKAFAKPPATSDTISGVPASGTKISSDGGFAYLPAFDSATWSGSLRKLKLLLDEGTLKIAANAEWDAGDLLTGMGKQAPSPGPASRNVFTSINTGKSLDTVEFKWSKLAAVQQAFLNASPVNSAPDGNGEQRVNYLRGDRSFESPGGSFRTRKGVLGDIVSSNPVYVGSPALNVQGAGYQKFFDDYKDRTKAVYVGANDGMLHAFNASDGAELFAYVPNAVLPGLNKMTLPEYVHRPYVDGGISVAEARIGSGWRSVLASGMGGGAQGVFALDVTNPADFTGGKGVLWEFTDGDDADMGNVPGAPVIAKFRTKNENGLAEFKYFAVVPSGLNNYIDDGMGKFDAAAPGALFLLSLDKAPSESWTLNGNYYKFKMPIADASQQNGLSTPALVTGSDGAVRYVYAGDLQGNLWRLDFTGNAPWSNALGADSTAPLFTAKDSEGMRQSITAQPKVVFAPGGGYVVLFGTGKLIEDADLAPGNFKTQSFYAVLDTTHDKDKVAGRGQLAARTLTNKPGAYAVSGSDFAYGVSAKNKMGWYLDFPDSKKTGERSTTNPLVAYGRLYFNTLIPGVDACSKGTGRTYTLDALTGLPSGGADTGFLSEVGMLSSPALFETGSTKVGERDAIGRRKATKKYAVVNFGTGGAKGISMPAPGGSGETALAAGRVSWREILNWLELRIEANKK